MKKLLLLFSIFQWIHFSSVNAQEIVLSGYYYGINLFVQNPKMGNDQYCITNITVNGKKADPLKQNSAFDIEMSFVKIGSPVEVRIQHHPECTPKVLNGGVIKKREEFKFLDVNVNSQDIYWSAKGERVFGKYFIRRFEKNHWNSIHAISCKNTDGVQQYEYPIEHFPGDNKYQVKYLDSYGKSFLSDTISYNAIKDKVTFSPTTVKKDLIFSREVQFRIMDISGKVVKQGLSETVNCRDLDSGIYYVAFEDQIRQFSKK